MSVVVGVLVGLAVVTMAGAGGRRVGPGAPERPVDRLVRPRAVPDLAAVLHGVCAQLRAGAVPAEAWSRVLGTAAGGPGPSIDALLAATSGPVRIRARRSAEVVRVRGTAARRGRSRLRGRSDDGKVQRARAVHAAVQLSEELGAPLAGVLERIASAVAADEEAEGERRAALSGPRSTAQVLAWLPLLGVALGALLGADPVAVVISGGVGTVSAVLGVVLLLLGRWWTAVLLSRAGRAGDDPPGTSRSGTSRSGTSRSGTSRTRLLGSAGVRADAARAGT